MESIQKDRRAIVKTRRAIVAFGGNQATSAGPPERAITRALAGLTGPDLRLLAVSRFYRSPAFPAGSGPDYVNGAALVATGQTAEALLDRLHRAEAQAGRVRTARWQARVLDLDLIGMEDLVLPDVATLRHWIDLDPALQARQAPDRLILPHPRLQDRAFVLMPLAEIAPLWRHPLTGQTVAAMLAALPLADRAEIRPI